MTRIDKINFLKKVQAGLITPAEIKGRVKTGEVIIFKGSDYWLPGSNKIMTKKEVDEFTKGVGTVMFLPDNGLDKVNKK